MSYITTHTKIHFYPLSDEEQQIDIKDIAHSLSLICRANGHFPHFYSVAQHSINCMNEARARGYSERVQLGCLLHDASEAYLSDITRPIKPYLTEYLRIEEKLQAKIFNKWIYPELTEDELRQIFSIDDAILYYEFFNLMGEKLNGLETELSSAPTLDFEGFEEIEKRFVDSFLSLTE